MEIHSVSWEEGDGKRLSVAMATRKFLGPKSYCMEKKKKVLKAPGASVCVKNVRIKYSRKRKIFRGIPRGRRGMTSLMGAAYSTFPRRPLEIGLFYFMPKLFIKLRDLSGIEDESQKKRALTPTYYWKKKILHTYLLT